MPGGFRKLSPSDPTPDHDRPEVLLAGVAVVHRRLGPSSSATTSTTDRALPSSAVQARCWSRPTTTTRLPLLSDSAACLAWSRHTTTVKKDASCSRRPLTATRNMARAIPPSVCRSSGSSVRLPAKLTAASVMVLPLPVAWPGGLPLDRGDGGCRGMPTEHQGQATAPTKSAIDQAHRPWPARVPSWLVGHLRLGVGHASTGRPDPSTLGVVGERGSRHESRLQLGSGRLFGLLQDPTEVVGAAVDDRDGHDAGHLVGVLPLGAVHDLRDEAAPGAQGDSALGRVVDLALPAVDGADGLEVVPRGAQPVGHQSAGELDQPVWVGRGDDDLADLIGWEHLAPSARQPGFWLRPRSWPCCSLEPTFQKHSFPARCWS